MAVGAFRPTVRMGRTHHAPRVAGLLPDEALARRLVGAAATEISAE